MMTYFNFYHSKGWHPRDVDRLYDDEEYWLPIMEDAADSAAAVWSEIQAKQ